MSSLICWTLEEVGAESEVPDFIPLGILANEEVSKVGKICPHSKSILFPPPKSL